jgi:hypothetical protein
MHPFRGEMIMIINQLLWNFRWCFGIFWVNSINNHQVLVSYTEVLPMKNNIIACTLSLSLKEICQYFQITQCFWNISNKIWNEIHSVTGSLIKQRAWNHRLEEVSDSCRSPSNDWTLCLYKLNNFLVIDWFVFQIIAEYQLFRGLW